MWLRTYSFEPALGFFRFFATPTLETPVKTKLQLYKLHQIVLHFSEILIPKKVRPLEIPHDFYFFTPGNSMLFLFLTPGYSTCLEIQYPQPSPFSFFLEQPILILHSYIPVYINQVPMLSLANKRARNFAVTLCINCK